MYSAIAILFLISVLILGAGFLGRIGTQGIREIDANVAATFGLMFTYSFVLLSFSSFSEVAAIFETMCGGVPFLDLIADYGSFQKVLQQDSWGAATSFLDAVILSATINILSLLPLTKGSARGKIMVKMFTGMVLALVSLFVLNFVVKESLVYQWIIAVIGGVITIISLGTLPLVIISKLDKTGIATVGLIGTVLLFSKSKAAGILRDSFFKAIVYVLGIWVLEKNFGSIANGASLISSFLVAFAPTIIMLIGIYFLFKTVKL